MGILRKERPELGSREIRLNSGSSCWSRAISEKLMPREVIELMALLNSSTLFSSIGLSTEWIGLVAGGGWGFEQMQLMLVLGSKQTQLMLPALMQLMAETKMCSWSSSQLGRDRASATTFAFPQR